MHEIRNKQGGNTDDDFWTQYGSVNPRMCLCVKITSRPEFGSDVVAFTSNTRDLTLPGHSGVTFRSTPGIVSTDVESALDEATNLEMTGIYNSDSFEQYEVLARKWDFAEVELFTVCWGDTDLGEFVNFAGNLGEFKDRQIYFTAEGRGPIAQLSNDVNKVTARLCRCKRFGDDECQRDLNDPVEIDGQDIDIIHTSTIDGQAGSSILNIASATLDADFLTLDPEFQLGFFRHGAIEITSGINTGVEREISWNSVVIGPGYIQVFLKRPFPFPFSGGETVQLTAGCDRTIEMCILYENIINRRAEDYTPGIEAANRVPSAN